MQGVAAAMGPPCNAISIKNHIAKLRAMAREQKVGGNSSDPGYVCHLYQERRYSEDQNRYQGITGTDLPLIQAIDRFSEIFGDHLRADEDNSGSQSKELVDCSGHRGAQKKIFAGDHCKFLKPPSCLSERSNSVSPRPTARGVLPCTNGRPLAVTKSGGDDSQE